MHEREFGDRFIFGEQGLGAVSVLTNKRQKNRQKKREKRKRIVFLLNLVFFRLFFVCLLNLLTFGKEEKEKGKQKK